MRRPGYFRESGMLGEAKIVDTMNDMDCNGLDSWRHCVEIDAVTKEVLSGAEIIEAARRLRWPGVTAQLVFSA
jgi:hypothetical protein